MTDAKIGASLMDAGVAAVAVAIVGVVGTLLSPVLAQRTTVRANRAAFEAERLLRREERVAATDRIEFEERRAEYTALNSLARRCRNQLLECASRHDATGALVPDDVAAAHAAWTAYVDRYDSAQMILADEVLAIASRLNRLLYEGYQRVQQLAEAGTPDPRRLVEFCDGPVLELATQMRRSMRADLAVGQSFVPSIREPQSGEVV